MTDKLWQAGSGQTMNPLIEAYTIGNDLQIDQQLLGYDITASKAHAGMLQKIGILTNSEAAKMIKALGSLYEQWQSGKFALQQKHEDGHTAIEMYLVEQLGDIGKKIHTGRSRNDQALVMMRLYLKSQLEESRTAAEEVSATFKKMAKKSGDSPMPGYTHMQKAMPTTVACWLDSYADGFADSQTLINATLALIDQNPLGSAAGFTTTLAVDREYTTTALGFSMTQENPMYCGLSRGLFELLAVQALAPMMVLAGKFAADMMLFTTKEFGFFSLPASFTTGSSIMPHKANYDVFEIMRAKSHTFSAYASQLQILISGVGSGYHRDLQLTKKLTLKAFEEALNTMEVLSATVANLQLNESKLQAAISPEMQGVTKINKLVSQGTPFRDAYNQVKTSLG